MVGEEHRQVGHAVVVEAADIERERAHREQEDHDEHIGQRRREIGRKLALEDGPDVTHAASAFVRAVSCVVIERYTSSCRPASAYNSLTSHFSRTTSALISSIKSAPAFGNAVSWTALFSRAACLTLVTVGSSFIFVSTEATCAAGSTNVTAL